MITSASLLFIYMGKRKLLPNARVNLNLYFLDKGSTKKASLKSSVCGIKVLAWVSITCVKIQI